MGLTQSDQTWLISPSTMFHECKSQKQLLQKMIFIQSRSMNNLQLALDNAQIFRLKQAPYESLMKISRTFQYQSPLLLQYSQILKNISQSITHKNLATIHFIKINNENNMCMRSVKIQHYSTYYGIQLRDVIENRKNQDFRFTQGEILYVAKSLVNFGNYLKKNNITFGHYQSKNIFLSDNGYIKLYLFHILPENKHTNYFTLLSTKPSTSQLPLAPQMFIQLCQNNMTPMFDFYKADLFSIGMIIIEMIMQSTLQRYYKFGRDNVSFNEINLKKDLQQIRLNGIYDEKVIYFLQQILQTNPSKRWNFEQADNYLEGLKKQFQFACRLNLRYQEDQQNEFAKKISFKSQQPESQYVLKSIQNSLQSKLNPLPLKSLSKLVINRSKQQNDLSIHKSIYTRRRNTGVSIISSSSHHHNKTLSKRDQKCSKFTTVRNSRVGETMILNKKQQSSNDISLVTDFQTKIYASQKYPHPLHQQDYQSQYRQKTSQNWLTLGNTRITEQNNKTFTLLPPKNKKPNLNLQKNSTNSNPKLQIHTRNKQNEKYIQKNLSTISTHIKIHKKNMVSPKTNVQQKQIRLNNLSREKKKQEVGSMISNTNIDTINDQNKPIKTVRPKMKINQHIR